MRKLKLFRTWQKSLDFDYLNFFIIKPLWNKVIISHICWVKQIPFSDAGISVSAAILATALCNCMVLLHNSGSWNAYTPEHNLTFLYIKKNNIIQNIIKSRCILITLIFFYRKAVVKQDYTYINMARLLS
jgi:hypothetical protein